MSNLTTFRRRRGTIAVLTLSVVGAWMLSVGAHAGGTVGTSSFGGARIGAGGGFSGYAGGPARGSSVIRHGDTGFSIYSQDGVTRVIGVPRVSKRVLLPDGSSTRVIGDGRGGAYLFGAQGNHRILANPRLPGGDGP